MISRCIINSSWLHILLCFASYIILLEELHHFLNFSIFIFPSIIFWFPVVHFYVSLIDWNLFVISNKRNSCPSFITGRAITLILPSIDEHRLLCIIMERTSCEIVIVYLLCWESIRYVFQNLHIRKRSGNKVWEVQRYVLFSLASWSSYALKRIAWDAY